VNDSLSQREGKQERPIYLGRPRDIGWQRATDLREDPKFRIKAVREHELKVYAWYGGAS